VSPDDIDQEIKRQKGVMGKCLTIKCLDDNNDKNQIEGIFCQQKPEKKTKLFKLESGEGQISKFEHATVEGSSFAYVERSHKWQLIVANRKTYWSQNTEHGNPPPGGEWTTDDKKETTDDKKETINLQISKSTSATDKSGKRDIDCTAGSKIESRTIGEKAVIPSHFRLKEKKVYYDPALDDDGDTLMVMSLNTFETVEWVESVETDNDVDSDLPDIAGSKFLLRKIRTTIEKGTVGVVVAKKSKEEAVINWCVGERRFFPPLQNMAPTTPIHHRLKATVKLTNLMEVGKNWRDARKKLEEIKKAQRSKAQVDDIEMKNVEEPEREDTIPYCYREAGAEI